MPWLSIISGVLSILQSLIGWLHDRQIIDAATKDVLLKNSQESLDAIDKANKARESVRDDLTKHPDTVLRPDNHTRND